MTGNNQSGRPGTNPKNRSGSDSPRNEFNKLTPRDLPIPAKRYWKKLVDLLKPEGVLKNQDEFALSRLCQLYAWRDKCQKVINDSGMTFEKISDRGAKNVCKRPEADLMKTYSDEISRYERKFGLTPGDRKSKGKRGNKGKGSVRDRY